MSPRIAITDAPDYQLLRTFLSRQSLPTDDLTASQLPMFALAQVGADLVGTAAIEYLDGYGLLRSVAVEPSYRQQGIADDLVGTVLAEALRRGTQQIYLITNTAEGYFAKRGFVAVDRALVPAAIANTAQFAGLCPSSAVVMKYVVDTPQIQE